MQQDAERSRLVLDMLNSVDATASSRSVTAPPEIRRCGGAGQRLPEYCIKKGYVKVKRIPARAYSYLLTPKGFAEKSRLTLMHLSNSLSSSAKPHRRAQIFGEAAQRGWSGWCCTEHRKWRRFLRSAPSRPG